MNVEETIKKVQEEQKEEEQYDAEGMARLEYVLSQYQGEYKLIWSHDLLEKIKNEPQKRKHTTGVAKLDELIGGFYDQQVVSLIAHPKHGKTQMGMFLIEQMEKANPVMIPIEQSNEELIDQRQENGYSIPRFLSPENLASRVTTEWIEHRVIEGVAKYNTKFVVIDHLGYINDMGEDGKFKNENESYRISMVMKDLKNIAKRWHVCILVVAHTIKADRTKTPSLEDIKGSAGVEQESDLVMALWRKNTKKKGVYVHDKETLLSVLAARRKGRTGNVGLIFNSETGRYDENQDWVDSLEKAAEQEAESENFGNL